jgi:hypothetical protein
LRKDIFCGSDYELTRKSINDKGITGAVTTRIHKADDEWYIVSTYHHHTGYHKVYRCDQMEGLLKLLNDVIK